MSDRIRIPSAVLDAIVQHARREAPDECCGLLVGQGNTVTAAVATRNLRASPTSYLIDPSTHLETLKRARAEGLAIVGAYHSHPATSAAPSSRDSEESVYHDFLHVIVSLGLPAGVPEVRAYRAVKGNFCPVELVTVD